jgi:uncharacterized protein
MLAHVLMRLCSWVLGGARSVALVAVLLGPQVGAAQPARFALPAPTGLVNDFAGVLGSRAPLLERIAEEVRQKSGGELAIVTLADLGPLAASDVARQIGREWKVGATAAIGDRTRNAGVVILIVPKETNASGRGACRIETGQGTEGFITDADAGTICREATAFFRQRDYASGTQLVVERVAAEFAREFGFTFDGGTGIRAPARGVERDLTPVRLSPVAILVILFILFVVVGRLTRGGGGGGDRGGPRGGLPVPIIIPGPGWGSGGGWSSGGGSWGGGGFGGFGGGGGFSGGGGGSDW